MCKTDKYGRNWLSGPTFLYESEEHWQIESIKYLDQNDAEIRQAGTFVEVSTTNNGLTDDEVFKLAKYC